MLAWLAVIINLLALAAPIVIVVVMFIVSPTYMQPMLHEPLGIVLLVLGVVLVAVGCGGAYVAVRLIRAGRPGWAVLLASGITVFVTFPGLWVVLLGPAILVLMSPA